MKRRFTQMKKLMLSGWLSLSLTAFAADAPKPLYSNDFEKATVGTVPDDLMVLGGEFTVKTGGTNQFLELPGAPLDSFGAQFGPATKDMVAVKARVFGT